jgi:IS5 family transposase
VHDSQALEDLINEADAGQKLYGDSAYIGQEASIQKCRLEDHIQEKASSTKKLTEQQKASNRRKSSLRCRIEHVFGFMTNTMKAMYIRTIGIERAEAKIGLANLTYNMMRCVQLSKPVYNVFLR